MKHLVLLGDSILDNGAYTNGAPDIAAQLRQMAPDAQVTLLAVDGHVTADIGRQLAKLPDGATHLVLSVGGNDALGSAGFLMERAGSVAEVLGRLRALVEPFRAAHQNALQLLGQTGLPFAVCTIYDANFDAQTAPLVQTALAQFNDAILRNAIAVRAPVIDLRAVCVDTADYANEIEPSAQGGAKIARAIVRVTTQHNWNGPTAIYS